MMPLAQDDYVFFWRETSVNGWASQWYRSPFRARVQINTNSRAIDSQEEYEFPTAEHWMMACKALLFQDDEVFGRIVNADAHNMRAVKHMGREVRGFDEAVWKAAREQIVLQGSLHKFRQNVELRQELLATGNKRLVEAAPRDRIWGIGYGEKRALAMRDFWGLNLLGKALEEVRGILRGDEASGVHT